MSFGLAGSHRTGKTSLAKQVAEDLGYFFHDGSVSKIMKEFGVDGVGDLPIAQRIEAQEFLLDKFLANLKWAPRPMLTDRTPLDMIGYMLGEVTMHNTDEATGKRVDNYVRKCLVETEKNFDTICILRPLPVYVVDPKSPPPNPAFQAVVQYLIEGAARQIDDEVMVHTITTTKWESRRSGVVQILFDRMGELQHEASKAISH